MRAIATLFAFAAIFFSGIFFKSWGRVYGQALPADIFTMPLGYHFGISYDPHVNTLYGIHNIALKGQVSCFGVDKSELYHAGVDLYRTDGADTDEDEVNSIANGEVVFAQDEKYPRYVVIIKHEASFDDPNNPKPIYSMYGHLHTIFVRKGDLVVRGQLIGTVELQTAGGYNDSHLHFEIRYFEDGSNLYPNYPNCNNITGEAGAGYTYPEHPDDFPTPGWGYTDPLAFIRSRSGQFLSLIRKDEPPTVTPTPTETATPLPTSTPTLTPTPTCVAGLDLVQNGDFEDTAHWNVWVSDTPNLITPYEGSPDDYALVMGYENDIEQTVYQTITVPPGVRSVDIQFQLYIRTLEMLPIDFDYLYVDVVGTGVTSASLLHTPFAPFTNRSPGGQWTQQTLHVADAAQLHAPIRLQFHATTNWALATAFYIDNAPISSAYAGLAY